MASATGLMTVAEFLSLSRQGDGFIRELRQGEVVDVTRPARKHAWIQKRLYDLLHERVAGGLVFLEFAFRPVAEYELRVADVAVVSKDRWVDETEDVFRGAPDIVIEVLSPSNTASEMYDKERLCLENGCSEFWVVHPEQRWVRVSTRTGPARTWKSSEEIETALFGGIRFHADEVFHGA